LGRGRCVDPFRPRAVPVLQPAVQRRRGDHPQRGRGRAAGAGRSSVAITFSAWRSRCAAHRRGRDGAVDLALALETAHRHPRRHARWPVDRGRAEGTDLGGIGESRRQCLRRRRRIRYRAETQSAPGIRSGRALLPGCQPGAAGAAGAVRGTARSVRHGAGGPAGRMGPQQPPYRHPAPRCGTTRRTVTIRFSDIEPTPDVFAAVMATGILSIGAKNHGYRLISDTMGVIATLGLVLLVALVAAKACTGDQKLRWDLTDPDVTLRMITFVAACAVIDTRLSSNVWVARVLGAVGLAS